jgi:hypothetical protein
MRSREDQEEICSFEPERQRDKTQWFERQSRLEAGATKVI